LKNIIDTNEEIERMSPDTITQEHSIASSNAETRDLITKAKQQGFSDFQIARAI
jgi:hypothetical protein